jgi:RimJ/RimL family protein N-acetyltransferase
MKAPERIETARLVIRRPTAADAEAVFARYAADRDVTRFVGWPAHRTADDTRAFLQWSDTQWACWPAGPYLVHARDGGALLGGTGLAFEASWRAMTGYVFAKDAWGKGYATEALLAMVDAARAVGVRRLYALCHTGHRPSGRVLEKAGFAREGVLRRYCEFPNLQPGEPLDVFCYARILDEDGSP